MGDKEIMRALYASELEPPVHNGPVLSNMEIKTEDEAGLENPSHVATLSGVSGGPHRLPPSIYLHEQSVDSLRKSSQHQAAFQGEKKCVRHGSYSLKEEQTTMVAESLNKNALQNPIQSVQDHFGIDLNISSPMQHKDASTELMKQLYVPTSTGVLENHLSQRMMPTSDLMPEVDMNLSLNHVQNQRHFGSVLDNPQADPLVVKPEIHEQVCEQNKKEISKLILIDEFGANIEQTLKQQISHPTHVDNVIERNGSNHEETREIVPMLTESCVKIEIESSDLHFVSDDAQQKETTATTSFRNSPEGNHPLRKQLRKNGDFDISFSSKTRGKKAPQLMVQTNSHQGLKEKQASHSTTYQCYSIPFTFHNESGDHIQRTNEASSGKNHRRSLRARTTVSYREPPEEELSEQDEELSMSEDDEWCPPRESPSMSDDESISPAPSETHQKFQRPTELDQSGDRGRKNSQRDLSECFVQLTPLPLHLLPHTEVPARVERITTLLQGPGQDQNNSTFITPSLGQQKKKTGRSIPAALLRSETNKTENDNWPTLSQKGQIENPTKQGPMPIRSANYVSGVHFYKCHICDMNFEKEVDLHIHQTDFHGLKSPRTYTISRTAFLQHEKKICRTLESKAQYKCGICGTAYHDEGVFRHHWEECIESSSTSPDHRQDHVPQIPQSETKIASVQTFMCSYCDMPFRRSLARYHHLTGYHKMKFICKICGAQCKSSLLLSQHEHNHARKKLERTKHKCKFCGEEYQRKQRKRFLEHWKKCRQKSGPVQPTQSKDIYICDMCGWQFIQQTALVQHKIKVHGAKCHFKCDICNEPFDKRSAILHHKTAKMCVRSSLGLSDGGGESGHVCLVCGRHFDDSKSLKLHASFAHSAKQKLFSCDLCNRHVCSVTSIKQHVLAHLHLNRLKCTVCERSYHPNHLPAHMKRVHGEGRQFKFDCDVCGITLSKIEILRNHKVNVHGMKHINRCDMCGKTFDHETALRLHKEQEHKIKGYCCDVCGRLFSEKRGLSHHVYNAHAKEKAYKCHICGKAYTHEYKVKQHMELHDKTKKYLCDLCNKPHQLFQHLQIHMKTHLPVKPFSCRLCGRRFASHASMYRHRVVHTGEKPYKCDICGLMVTQNSALARHKKLHLRNKV